MSLESEKFELFSLIPANAAALQCLEDPENAEFVHTPVGTTRAIKVSLQHVSNIPGCIISFGRLGDVYIPGSQISKRQCLFLLHETTGEIIFRDCSSNRNSSLFNRSNARANPLGGNPRQVVVRPKDDIVIGMGGPYGDHLQFVIAWAPWATEDHEEEKRRILERAKQSPLAVTRDEDDTPESRYETRVQVPWSEEKWVHRRLKQLGRGSFGTVHETVNMHTGDHLAVKTIDPTPQQRNSTRWMQMVQREVEILHKVFHPNLVEFRHCQGFRKGDSIELFMTLYEGSLEDILYDHPQISRDKEILMGLLQQMLRAVVYLAHKGIVHRDIKPANILYSQSTDFIFQWYLADFGLAKFVDQGQSQVGSGHFRAPEILSGGRQTHKADVYSLGMTMLVLASSESFRTRFRTDIRFRESVHFRNALKENPQLAPLLETNPDLRMSAQQAYQKFFGEDPEIQARPPSEIQFQI